MPVAQFLAQLRGVTDPEEKRKIIGREFVEVFQREAGKIKNAQWLAQGTIYPDVIESAGAKTKKATNIKSHHNVGGLPETLHLKLLEPLRELFKDEVRELGLALGLAARDGRTAIRFPDLGWGCAFSARSSPSMQICCGEPTRSSSRSCAPRAGTRRPRQAFAVFLPVRSVGVMGDGRTYEYVVALRAVQTEDFMTAHWAELPYGLLSKVSNRIINEVRGHQPRGLRHLRQAACDDRVGVAMQHARMEAALVGVMLVSAAR